MRGRRANRIAICTAAALVVSGLFAQGAVAVAPQLSKVGASAVTDTAATLKAKIDPQGKAGTYRFEVGSEDCSMETCATVAEGSIPSGSPVVEEVPLEGLSPATLYHYRVLAENGDGKADSGDRVLATHSATVFSGLPDGRAYEQASPVDKNGADALGDVPTIKATASGGGITFESTFGIPGGKGGQEFPTYLASRGQGNWSTQGLLPPFSAGERAQVVGWSPDYTEVFSVATRLGDPRASALIVQSTAGGEPVQITPYVAKSEYLYAGQSEDGSVVLFESRSKLLPEALEEFPNLYAWNRDTGKLSLAGIYNDETSPPKGTLAGPYAWTGGSDARHLGLGGADRGFYLRDERAIAPDGSVYFTEAGTGRLYRRLNPSAQQSPFTANGKGEEECEDPAKACTVQISASHKSDGKGPGGTDAAGPQPAAFQAAAADGSQAFFTSPEKLTNDANTGPEQSLAQIERDDLSGGEVEDKEFISPRHAVGVAVDGSHIYWADPAAGTIGRADIDGKKREPTFIVPGPVECEVKGQPGVFEETPSRPRYVAVDSEHIYWTNTGCSNPETGEAIEGTGTIGRADIDGSEAGVEAAFIKGASNPQGIAVNSTHIYWANAGTLAGVRAIGRATIDGGEVNQSFIKATGGGTKPYGVTLNLSHLYYSGNEEGEDNAFIRRLTLDGSEKGNPRYRQRRQPRRSGRLGPRLLGDAGQGSDRAGRSRTEKQGKRIHQTGRQTQRPRGRLRTPLLGDKRGSGDQPRQRPLPLRPREGRAHRPDTSSRRKRGRSAGRGGCLRRRQIRLLRRQRSARRGRRSETGELQGDAGLGLRQLQPLPLAGRIDQSGGAAGCRGQLRYRRAQLGRYAAGTVRHRQLRRQDRLPQR